MICCPLSGGIIIFCSSCCFSGLLSNEVILSAIFDPIKSPTAGAAFSKVCFPDAFTIFDPFF